MARGLFLSEKQRQEWREFLRLSHKHYQNNIRPTKVFVEMYRNNGAHWHSHTHVHGGLQSRSWPYDATTANLTYTSVKNTLPRVLLHHPKVQVQPRPMATGRAERLSGQTLAIRWQAALHIQQMLNWRMKEFDFRRQAERVQLDNHLRGIGGIRHGFAAPEDVSYRTRDKTIEFNHHEHIRAGWPFAIYWSPDETRMDALARSPEEMQWIGFRDVWRIEDLKKFPDVQIPDGLVPTIIAGFDAGDDPKDQVDANNRALQVLGRIPILEIWDRRTKRVIWWAEGLDQEIGVKEWPLDWEGLPYTMHADSEVNEEIAPISEQNITHELQQQLNRLLSMVLVYAKRGVSIIGVNKGQMDPEEVEKIQDAEILETVLTNVNPNEALARYDLTPIPQTLLLSIQSVREFIREIQGQGRIASGTRENVESGTEAAGIIEAQETRNLDRRRRIEDFLSRMVRKDFQVMQQTLSETQYLEVLDLMKAPQLVEITLDQIKQEYDIQIEVGSTSPQNEFQKKQEALQLASLLQSPLAPFLNPAFIARNVALAFGLDLAEALNSQEAAKLEMMLEEFRKLLPISLGSTGGGNGAAQKPQALAAALDSTKAPGAQPPQPGGGGGGNSQGGLPQGTPGVA